jgi:hypothetical protein
MLKAIQLRTKNAKTACLTYRYNEWDINALSPVNEKDLRVEQLCPPYLIGCPDQGIVTLAAILGSENTNNTHEDYC